MRLVERMTGSPPNCMYCGAGNTPDEHGKIGPFIDMEREVAWGDDAYLCEKCATQVGTLMGLAPAEELKKQQRMLKEAQKQVHDLQSDIALAREREQKHQSEIKTLAEAGEIRERVAS